MKQWLFNLLVACGSVLLLVLLVSLVMGFNPWLFMVNTAVYLLVVVGLFMALPAFLGFALPYWGIHALDSRADEYNDLGGWHFIPGTVWSVVLGLVWMKWVVPALIVLPQLSSWASGMFRFPVEYAGLPWGWFAVILFLAGMAYAIGAMARDD